MKPLIVYYSRRGENLVNGQVKNLTVGNTERLAGIIQELTGGDLFQIEPLTPYPADYYRCIDLARQDFKRNARPALRRWPESLDPYPVVYLGYPNYWGTMPMVVFSFLERFDFVGKTIKPFCTHEGSGMGRSERDLRHMCPGAVIVPGFPVRGAEAGTERTALKEWTLERL